MIQTTLFIRSNSPLLTPIEENLSHLREEYPHHLNVVDIDADLSLEEEFGHKAPVLDVGVYRLNHPFDIHEIRFAFEKAEERLAEARAKGNDVLVKRMTIPVSMTKADRFSRWFSNHYMVLVNAFTFLYVFLALLAPVFMKVKWELPAKVIYKAYSPLCHQLAYRTFFLFGEQPYYPLELAGMGGVITYSEATGFDENDVNTARSFLGNDALGFKMALCERDVAIYLAIFLFGLVFSLTGRKIKPLPWYLWLLIGIGPIALDGFSQLLGQTGLGIFNWMPLRESTPLLRAFTGAAFGLAAAWFGFPYLEESVLENRHEMRLKHAIVKQIEEQG
ncbi:MAG: DUF2085 domain-containing protein [Brevefilum sp.]|jgi:uncharacterized membrane protein